MYSKEGRQNSCIVIKLQKKVPINTRYAIFSVYELIGETMTAP